MVVVVVLVLVMMMMMMMTSSKGGRAIWTGRIPGFVCLYAQLVVWLNKVFR